MEVSEFLSLLEDLEDNIDDLEDALEPLLTTALSLTTKKLPVLDRAKLYVLIVYSIESLIFSYLRINGINAKEHKVFEELARVRQYFAKIKEAEAGPVKTRENMSLDKEAAGRMIKHALAGNDRYDAERKERELREKILAARKLKALEEQTKTKVHLPEPHAEVSEAQSVEEGEISEKSPAEITVPVADDVAHTVETNDTDLQSGQNKKRKEPEREHQETEDPSVYSKKARKRAKKEKRKKKRETGV